MTLRVRRERRKTRSPLPSNNASSGDLSKLEDRRVYICLELIRLRNCTECRRSLAEHNLTLSREFFLVRDKPVTSIGIFNLVLNSINSDGLFRYDRRRAAVVRSLD